MGQEKLPGYDDVKRLAKQGSNGNETSSKQSSRRMIWRPQESRHQGFPETVSPARNLQQDHIHPSTPQDHQDIHPGLHMEAILELQMHPCRTPWAI